VNVILWALANGVIIGAVWIGIVMYERQKRINDRRESADELAARIDALEASEARVAELEERLDFNERLLHQHREELKQLRGGG
jgi:F0F1-type ATP synthase membrane subunit b/b'